ncbi:hypothetical protein [Pseudoclavibacter sp. RFBB5]|uniref:hypothetical protein n=1 Tax=Pseudoclavibacter sp. RFBB5 TaxID=2080574 RepID=UPI000CE79E98|nr:hypothetical protein [Pseudoclavibacter sp. RFBB5]PPG27223.1 hypothetical protein C5B97_17550 [Pseudoclavibacter sp. RFBB5]
MKSVNVSMIVDSSSWWDKGIEVPNIDHEPAGHATWLRDHPSVFDTDHDETLLFVETGCGVSRCGTADDFRQDVLFENVPMGYTSLTLLEKRAVVMGGRVARLWPGERRPEGYVAGTVDAAGRPLGAGHDSILWHSIHRALRWSAIVPDRPFTVGAVRSSQAWH